MKKNKTGLPALPEEKPVLVPVSPHSSLMIEENKLLDHVVRDSTRKTYEHALDQMEALGLYMPCTPDEVLAFITNTMGKTKLNTLKLRLSAISYWHKKHREPNPINDPRITEAKKAVANLKDDAGERVKKVSPLIVDIVAKVNTGCLLEGTPQAKRDRLIFLLMYHGALRPKEVVSLRLQDVHLYHEGLMLSLWATKTGNKERYIPYNDINHDMCIFQAMNDWIEYAHLVNKNEWLIRGFYKGHRTLRDEQMSTRAIEEIVKRRIKGVGHRAWETFAGQSGRRGFVKDAIDNNVDPFSVAHGGGWKSLEVVMGYYNATNAKAVKALIAGTKGKH